MYSEKKTTVKDSYASLNFRIKRMLDDIIDVAFKGDPKIKSYHGFSFYAVNKENTRSSGKYLPSDRKIEVYNPSLGSKHIAKCCLHELSHHIDCMKNGCSGHQKPFYDIYRKLIYASLDMGILDKEDFNDEWSSDRNKVKKIVSEYVPKKINYEKKEGIVVKVYNSFSMKDELKAEGFKWNGLEKVWEKEIPSKDDIPPVLSSLDTNPDKTNPYYVISDPSDLKINASVSIVASDGSYEKRDILKERGFYFQSSKKVWVKKVDGDHAKSELMKLKTDPKLSSVVFSILK